MSSTWYTRDNPGNAPVLKRKYNLEKWQHWNIAQRALNLWGLTARFISHHWKHKERLFLESSFLIPASTWCYEPLWNPAIIDAQIPLFPHQGANCQVWSSRFDDTWRQRPNLRLPYKLVDFQILLLILLWNIHQRDVKKVCIFCTKIPWQWKNRYQRVRKIHVSIQRCQGHTCTNLLLLV